MHLAFLHAKRHFEERLDEFEDGIRLRGRLTEEVEVQLARELQSQDLKVHHVAVLSEVFIVREVRIRRIRIIREGAACPAGISAARRRDIGERDARTIRIAAALIRGDAARLAADAQFRAVQLHGDAHPILIRAGNAEVIEVLFVFIDISIQGNGPTRRRGAVLRGVIKLAAEIRACVFFDDVRHLLREIHAEFLQDEHHEGKIQPETDLTVRERKHEFRLLAVIRLHLFSVRIHILDITVQDVRRGVFILEVDVEERPKDVLQAIRSFLIRSADGSRIRHLPDRSDIEDLRQETRQIDARHFQAVDPDEGQGEIRFFLRIEIIQPEEQGGAALRHLRELEEELCIMRIRKVDIKLRIDAQLDDIHRGRIFADDRAESLLILIGQADQETRHVVFRQSESLRKQRV